MSIFDSRSSPSSAFQLASSIYSDLTYLKPFEHFAASQPTLAGQQVSFLKRESITQLSDFLHQLQSELSRAGLAVSQTFLIVWAVKAVPPPIGALLRMSLALEPYVETIDFARLVLHIEVWSRFLRSPRAEAYRQKMEPHGQGGIARFYAGTKEYKAFALVQWTKRWGLLSGASDVQMIGAPDYDSGEIE